MDKLVLIRRILDTDPETDRRIMAVIDAAGQLPESLSAETGEDKIHIEERVCDRKCVQMEAAINTGKAKINARVEDVSETGAFIRTQASIGCGEHIAIRLITETGEEFPFISQVVRVEERGIGVQIKTISETHRKRFIEFVSRL